MKTVSNFVKSEKYLFKESVSSFLPPYAMIPVLQPGMNHSRLMAKEGDVVQEGQVIGLCSESEGSGTTVNIHSPVPGRIVAFEECNMPDGRLGKALKIQMGGAFSFLGKKAQPKEWENLSSEVLLDTFNDKGVVNTFDRGIMLAEEIKASSLKKGRFLIVRMFDEDPSRMTDLFLASRYTEKVMEGAFIVAKAYSAEGVVFVCPKKNKITLDLSIMGRVPTLCIETDNSRYPSGLRNTLVHTVRKASRNTKDRLFSTVNHRSLFIDPQTAIYAYDSVVNGQPVVDRYVHVTGNCLKCSGLFKVRLGTTIGNLAQQCGGFKKRPVKIVVNGMLSGKSVSSLDIPVTNTVKSICFIPVGDLGDQHMSNCTRCGNCRNICPSGIYPDLLFRHSTGGKSVGDDLLSTSRLCSSCNLCNTVCPSRLPLSQTIAFIRENHDE